MEKYREATKTEIEHEEYKVDRERDESKKPEDLGKIHNFSPSSNVPFKVEVKLEISMYDGQVNVEVFSSWLKQLEVYFGLYQIPEASTYFFVSFEDEWTCYFVVGELCGCI